MRWKKQAVVFLFLCLGIAFWFSDLETSQAEGIITIDSNKKYDGMNASFAKGYMPSIKKNTMTLIVPFVTNVPLCDDALLVGVSFEKIENSPFQFKNYQKKVTRSKKGIFLYQCRIKLNKNRINGQYPLYLSVQAQTQEEVIRQDFTIYVDITDGKSATLQDETILDDQRDIGVAESDSIQPEKKEEIIHQPRVMLSENNLQGTNVLAGERITWTLSAKNCSNQHTIENMKVTLLSETNMISFEKSTWYFRQVGANAVFDLSQEIFIGKKSPPDLIPIQLQFDYEDKQGNQYSATETIQLSVSQVQQAELVNLSFPEEIYESDLETLNFQVLNTGLAIIYNARVRIEGKGLFAQKEMFLGNLEPGTSADGEIQIFAGTLNMDTEGNVDEHGEKYGDTSAEVIFSYENEQGEVTEKKLNFHTAIRKPEIVELNVEKKEPETNQWWITIVFFVILFLTLIIIWLYLRMKYYQRMRMEQYERT